MVLGHFLRTSAVLLTKVQSGNRNIHSLTDLLSELVRTMIVVAENGEEVYTRFCWRSNDSLSMSINYAQLLAYYVGYSLHRTRMMQTWLVLCYLFINRYSGGGYRGRYTDVIVIHYCRSVGSYVVVDQRLPAAAAAASAAARSYCF